MTYWEGRAAEHTREIERLRAELAACRAASPPAPAAIVQVRAAEFDAFERIEDAESWMASQCLTPWRTWIERVRRWTWHPTATPDAAGEGTDEGRD